ncbi:MAG TPA: class I adenylate-forming enzyme family protein [Candidatus Binataceae bacterium]|nr:class I adenylate-forming enzyme family protein [Candidatus Binataceae bacterium]
MSLVSVSDLLAGSRPAEHLVALAGGKPIDLAQFRSDIEHNAKWLADQTVKCGAVVCDSGYWFIVGLLALLRVGAKVILPQNSQPGTLRSLAGEIDALLIDCESVDAWREHKLQSGHRVVEPFRDKFDASQLYFFTSGSTGEMKRVEKSLAMFEREALLLEQKWGADLGRVPVIGTVTHQHVFGMTFRIMWPLVAGRPFHAEFHVAWELLKAHLDGPSIIITSPAQLTRLGGVSPERPNNQPRLIISAGAPLPLDAAREAASLFGCPPTEILGSTEAGVIASRHPVIERDPWEPLPNVEVGADSDGIMLLRSPHSSDSGWSRQPDRIALVGDGCFRLEGRVDRVIKIEGKRVSLERQERELTSLSWVSDAAIVALGGERAYLGAVVQLSEAGIAEMNRLGKFRFERKLRRELSVFEDPAVLPRRWRFVKSMPADGLGKRKIKDMLALLEQNA